MGTVAEAVLAKTPSILATAWASELSGKYGILTNTQENLTSVGVTTLHKRAEASYYKNLLIRVARSKFDAVFFFSREGRNLTKNIPIIEPQRFLPCVLRFSYFHRVVLHTSS